MRKAHVSTVLLAFLTLLCNAAATADVPTLISYQGILADENGEPVNGTADMTFRIYDDPNSGSQLWSESQENIAVADGLFNVLLGTNTPIGDDVFSGPDRWLGVEVDGGPELEPRTRLTSVPYSHRVSTVDGATGGTISGDVDIASDLTVDGQIDATGASSKIRFYYPTLGDLPDPSTYHGMFAHVHGEGRAYYAHAGQWVPITDENNPFPVTTSEIVDGSILFSDINQNGAASGQVMKWNGAAWAPANDETGGGGGAGGWVDDGTIVRLETYSDSVGIGTSNPSARLDVNGSANLAGNVTIGVGNANTGTYSIAAGVSNSATGTTSNAFGTGNTASGHYSTVAGGADNTVSGEKSFIGGGEFNIADNFATTVGGGYYNRARGEFSVVGGGGGGAAQDSNAAIGDYSTVCGGRRNRATDVGSTVSGGSANTVTAQYGTICGGTANTVSGLHSNIGGGRFHECLGGSSSIIGGESDTLTVNAIGSLAFGTLVYLDNAYRAAFFNGTYNGRVTINRDDQDGTPTYPLQVGTASNNGNGAYLTAGGVWTNGSSRSFKENGRPLEGERLLERISLLAVDTWQYRDSDEQHIGPYAEDFVAAFDVGALRETDGSRENHYLAAGDVAGVALAGVKELIRENEELRGMIYQLKEEIELLKDNR